MDAWGALLATAALIGLVLLATLAFMLIIMLINNIDRRN